MTVLITRFDTSDQGTFGKLETDGFSCFTGELPWLDNKSNVSCIPAGSYTGKWEYSTRFKRKMYGIYSAPGRAGLRIHSANFMGNEEKGLKKQLNGCIALSERLGTMDGQKALLISAPAVRRFEAILGGKDFNLEIVEKF